MVTAHFFVFPLEYAQIVSTSDTVEDERRGEERRREKVEVPIIYSPVS